MAFPTPLTWCISVQHLTKGCRHGLVQRRLAVPRRQVRPSIISALVIVVFDIETGELGEVNAQCAAGVVDVLAIQRLWRNNGEWGPRIGLPTSPEAQLTSLACWALTGSAYCSSAWNWLFLVNVIIFRTVPNLEKICKRAV